MVKTQHVPLDEHVKELLEARRGEWQSVADGSGISYSWLSKFACDMIQNPGYRTLLRLADYLERTAPKRSIIR